MTINEVALFIEGRREVERDQWRRTRVQVWATLQSQSRKRINPKNIFAIPGDGEKQEAPRSGVSKAEQLALVAKYQEIQRKKKEKDGNSEQLQFKRINNG